MADITKRVPTIDEVIIKKDQVVSGTVAVTPATTGESGLVFGTILTSTDGGDTWTTQEKPLWVAGTYAADDEVFHEGHSWKSLEDANTDEPKADNPKWQDLGAFDANGVLVENITQTSKVAVLITGTVREKHLVNYDNSMKKSLFKNKIILK
jgi:hypothetical protein